MSKTTPADDGKGPNLELYRKYRPKTLDEVVGQDAALLALRPKATPKKMPHAVGLFGPSGTGKTTIARVLGRILGCESDMSFTEINCAGDAGIDEIRGIRRMMRYKGVGGGRRCYLFDEAHMMTSPAQNGLLKMTEDPPPHVYFFLATTHPDKLIDALRSRLFPVLLGRVADDDIRRVVNRVAAAEGGGVGKKVVQKIAECSYGSVRRALVWLERVAPLETEAERLAAIVPDKLEKSSDDLVKLLCRFGSKPTWKEVALLLREMKQFDPEEVRRRVLGYANTIALIGNVESQRACQVISAFRESYINTGAAGLTDSCFYAVSTWEATKK